MTTKEFEKRIKTFVLSIISLLHELPKTDENLIFIKQIIRSASSIGANYAEATCAHTRQDFLHTINICRKEANETVYWLELIVSTNPKFEEKIFGIIDEGKQILRMFISSVKTTKNNQ